MGGGYTLKRPSCHEGIHPFLLGTEPKPSRQRLVVALDVPGEGTRSNICSRPVVLKVRFLDQPNSIS